MLEETFDFQEIFFATATIGLAVAVVLLILVFAFEQGEAAYASVFERPFYVHLYFRPKPLEPLQRKMLTQISPFYKKLSTKRKRYFEHRIQRFLNRYEIIGREGFVITNEVKVRVASTYAMLSFGWRNYLIETFDKIIIFPEAFWSSTNQEYHKGEFNPGLKTVVFSWVDFVTSQDITNNNLNLGIHEFAHVLHFHSHQNSNVSSLTFNRLFKRCIEEITCPNNNQALHNSGYFRDYAYTNSFEFLAVVLEHFFETPTEFNSHFPELYKIVSKMLNYRLN